MILPQLLKREERREDPYRIPSNVSLGVSHSGVRVTDLTAMQQATVWSCVSLLSDTVSNLPTGLFRKAGGIRRPVEPEPILLREPNPGMTMPEWLAMGMISLLLRGNAYGLITSRDSLEYPTQIEPLHPDEVLVRRDVETKRLMYSVSGERFQASDIMHIKGLRWPGIFQGLNPIEYGRQMIGAALAAQEYGARYFGESATPTGVLEVDGDVSEDAMKVLRATWDEQQGNRSRRPAILAGGMKFHAISLSPEQSQFLETRGYSRGEIAGFFRVPPHMVGDMDKNSTWGSGIEEIGLQFVTYSLTPWITRFEKQLSAYFPRPQYVKFNVAALLRGRLLDRYQAYLVARQGGWMNVDEIRALEEEPPVPGGEGQKFSQPLNWGPLGFDPLKGSGDGNRDQDAA